MSQPQRPPSQEPYLSTEDIVERVRAAQGKTRFLTFRKPMLAVGAVLVTVGMVALLLNQPPKQTPAADAPVPSELSTAQAPSASGPDVPPQAAVAATQNATPKPAQAAPLVRVLVEGRAGIITLDGRRLTVDRHWSGQVRPGRHVVGVRCASATLRRRILVEQAPITLSFDCQGRRVEQR